MFTEYITFVQAQRIYIIVVYTWMIYNHADSCYNTVKKAYGFYKTTSAVSNSLYRKLQWWWYKKKQEPKVVVPLKKSIPKAIELQEKQPSEQSTSMPNSIDELVVEYFGA